jgi:class 3 adenylate cyclase
MTMDASTPRRKLSAILMVDVSGFSRMMGRNEERTTALIREFHDRTRRVVQAHHGRVVDTAGDSVFGEFDSVVNAVRCAQAIQEAQAAANASQVPTERIETRIGVHLGDVIVQDDRVYGDGVNIAARLQTIAAPGSICVSEAVYQQVYTKLDLAFEDLGVHELRNIEHPVRLYRMMTPESARLAAPAPCATRVRPVRCVAGRAARRRVGARAAASIEPCSPPDRCVSACNTSRPPSHGRPGPRLRCRARGRRARRFLRLYTGRPAFFLMALGAGLVLAAVAGNWRHGAPWWLVAGGIVVTVVGLAQLRTRD